MDIASTLRTVPGVTIGRRNIVGSYAGAEGGAIFIRGQGLSRPGSELVTLYDGVPRINAVYSHPLLDLLSADSAHAMRVYKSPQPQVFGNAFAAVAIEPRFTLEPAGAPATNGFASEVSAAYGTDDTVVQSAVVSANFRQDEAHATTFAAGQSFRRSAGHRPNAGGELEDYFANLTQTLGKNWSVSAVFDHTNNYSEDPGPERDAALPAGAAVWPYHQGDYHTRDYFGTLTLANHFDAADGYIKTYWHHGRAVWHDQGRYASNGGIRPPDAASTGNTDDTTMRWDNYGVRLRETLRPTEGGELVAGFDFDAQSGKQTSIRYDGTAGAPLRREEFQVYSPYFAVSQRLGDRNRFHATPSAGLRFYAHNFFKPETAPHGGLVLGYKDETTLHLTAARGVNYAGLNVAALAASMPTLGKTWKNLRAEVLNHYEIGVTQRLLPALEATVTAFRDEGRHRYIMRFPAAGPANAFITVPSYHNSGVEASLSWAPTDALTLFAGGTWLRTSSDLLPFTPEWTASAGATWRFFDKFRLSVDFVYQDRMTSSGGFARASNATEGPLLPAVVLVNARLAYTFSLPSIKLRRGEIFIAGENLADRKYYYQPGYPLPGLSAMIGLKAAF
jgi:iron complex outermembrane receptor protein